MKILKYVIAIVLTIVMLIVARNNSRGRPEYFDHQENGYTFEYNTVPKGIAFSEASIPLTIRGTIDDNIRPIFRRVLPGADINDLDQYDYAQLIPCDSADDCFKTIFTTGKKNDRFHYYFQVADSTGTVLATFTQPDGTPFMFRYIGEVPIAITVAHIALIFATVFFISLATTSSFSLIRRGSDVKPLAKFVFLAALFAFLGGYPFGIPMNYYAFNGSWEGVPFGTDATDNKTQLLFVYLLFLSLATWGSLKGKPNRDIYSPKALGWFGLGSFAVMLFIYLIPHSIQFSPVLTYTFCYSWIGVVVLLYGIGRFKSART